MLGVSSNIIGHIPRAHSKHDGLIPCCWDGDERQQIVICEHCGLHISQERCLSFIDGLAMTAIMNGLSISCISTGNTYEVQFRMV